MSHPHVTVVGAGAVGATTAHLLALKGLADVTLIDVVEGLAEGKALDLLEAAPVEGFDVGVRGTTDLGALRGSRLVVAAAGLARKPGMSRDDLLAANAKIVGPLAEQVAALAPDAVVILVTNPLDIMVALALRRSRLPRQRILGMAGVLDTARLRTFVAERLGVAPREVEAMVLGSHGDLMVPLPESIRVRGRPLAELMSKTDIAPLLQRTKDGGAEIVKLLKTGSASYAPASAVVQMARAILEDTHETLPVCVALEGEYGLRDVCLGVPAQLGAAGVERIVELELSPEARTALETSASNVREGIKSLMTLAGRRG